MPLEPTQPKGFVSKSVDYTKKGTELMAKQAELQARQAHIQDGISASHGAKPLTDSENAYVGRLELESSELSKQQKQLATESRKLQTSINKDIKSDFNFYA